MTHFLYGGKIGLSTIIRLTIKLCAIYVPKVVYIKAYIDGNGSISEEQKTTLKTWLDGIADACEILRILQITVEQ